MRALVRAPVPHRVRRSAPILAAAWLVLACSTAGPKRPEQVVVRDTGGFRITERVHVGSGARADFEAAVGLLEQGEYDEGIARLLRVTEAAPMLTAAHIDLGMAYARKDDLERAEKSLEQALRLSPHHPVALNELGIVLRRTGRFGKARESYEKALAAHPDFHFARRNLAILCDVYLRDAQCALEHYERYLQVAPDDEAAAMWVADLRNRVSR